MNKNNIHDQAARLHLALCERLKGIPAKAHYDQCRTHDHDAKDFRRAMEAHFGTK